MRVLFAITVLAICLPQASAVNPIPSVHGSGRWNGEVYEVAPSSSNLMAVQLNPEREIASLSVPKAVGSARIELKKMVGDLHLHFTCDEVKMVKENGYWFYVVTFYSEHSSVARKGDVGTFPASLPFIVYLNGFVEPPFKKMN